MYRVSMLTIKTIRNGIESKKVVRSDELRRSLFISFHVSIMSVSIFALMLNLMQYIRFNDSIYSIGCVDYFVMKGCYNLLLPLKKWCHILAWS